MKKMLVIFLTLLMIIAFASGCNNTAANPETTDNAGTSTDNNAPVEEKGVLLMATTTSTDNTGLLDYLAPIFLVDTGWELQWTAVGTGEALALGEAGEVDIVLVHAQAKEEAFVADGYGVERFPIMYNDFVIIGPTDGPIAKTSDINAVFTQIQNEQLTFVSRGDDSGTHTKELGIWKALGIDPTQNPNYISAGAGMSDTIIMADEKLAYSLADRGTWLATKLNADNNIELEIICEGDPSLLNQYGVIAVSDKVNPDTNLEGCQCIYRVDHLS